MLAWQSRTLHNDAPYQKLVSPVFVLLNLTRVVKLKQEITSKLSRQTQPIL